MSHGVQGRSAFDSPVPQISPVADPRESATIVDIEETPTQTYNARGHPENATSRTLTRQGRRAQNEVLSTVGVCVYVDENGKVVANSDAGEDARQQQRETTLAIIQENEVGLSLEVCDIFVHYAVTNFIDNIRKRIQTFVFYTPIPLGIIMRAERRQYGQLSYMFSGASASILFILLDGSVTAAIDISRDILLAYLADGARSSKAQAWMKKGISILDLMAKVLVRSALIPLHFYGNLQQLALIPAWPIVPNPFRISYLAALLPQLPHYNGLWNLPAYGLAILTSPLSMFLWSEYYNNLFDDSLTRYTRAAIPRPDNPDNVSVKIHTEDGITTSTSPVDEYPRLQGSLGNEIRKDLAKCLESLYVARAVARQFVRTLFRGKRPTVEFPERIVETEHDARGLDVPNRIEGTSSLSPSPREAFDRTANVAGPPSQVNGQHGSAPPPPTSVTSSAVSDEGSPIIQPSNVQIRTRTGSTSTLHMEVEINTQVRGAPFTSNFSASSRNMEMDNMPSQVAHDFHYRVTSLTLAPSCMLGARIRDTIVTVLGLPLESMFLRSLAHTFVQSGPTSRETAWLQAQIYPVGVYYFLGPKTLGIAALATYFGKIILCIGIETFLSLRLWHVTSDTARWIGRRYYSWRKL